MRAWPSVMTMVLVLSIGAAPAHAQDDSRRDAVVTTDGSLIRGQLLEHVPGSHVLLRVGDEERRIPYAQVVFAGPADRAPDPRSVGGDATPPAPPPPPSQGPEVTAVQAETSDGRVEPASEAEPSTPRRHQVVSDPQGLTLSWLTDVQETYGTATVYSGTSYRGQTATTRHVTLNYTKVCTAPCSANLPDGRWYFYLNDDYGRGYEVRRRVRVDGPGTLHLSIQNRRTVRRVLIATAVIGIAAGAAGILVGMRELLGMDEFDGDDVHLGGTIVGSIIAVAGLGALVTIGIGGGRDRGRVRFVPLVL